MQQHFSKLKNNWEKKKNFRIQPKYFLRLQSLAETALLWCFDFVIVFLSAHNVDKLQVNMSAVTQFSETKNDARVAINENSSAVEACWQKHFTMTCLSSMHRIAGLLFSNQSSVQLTKIFTKTCFFFFFGFGFLAKWKL